MNIKLGQIENILQSMEVLILKELPIKTSYKLSKLIKTLTSEYELFESKRIDLVKRFAEKDKDGNVKEFDGGKVNICKDTIQEFNDSFKELCDIDVVVEFEHISIESLGDINISTKDLFNLEMFFVD